MSTFVGSATGVPYTGLNYIDGLLWGNRWRIENDSRKLTYSFVNNQPWDDNFYNAELTAFHNAMQAWANVADFQLEFSGFNDLNAEIRFHSVTGNQIGGSSGMAIPPGEIEYPYIQGDVMLNWEKYQSNPDTLLIPGGHNYYVFVHEIGHALGLAHPHDDGGNSSIFPGVDNDQDSGNFGLNQFIGTVMSYVTTNSPYSPGFDTNYGFAAGPMAFDIAAIQYLYGINDTYKTGDDTYYLPTSNSPGNYWTSIWDAGGNDTISAQNATNSAVINLNDATLLNNDPGAGGYISQVNGILGGFTIANSQGGLSVIENAIGGQYNDTIIGNEYNNFLEGKNGNDLLYGGAGNDTLDGGSGHDTLFGEAGADRLIGGSGNDILDGGTGADTLIGGLGNETYIVDNASDVIIENLGEGIETVEASISYTLDSANALNHLTLTGTGNINGTGNSNPNEIIGNTGNNQLMGGNGHDTLLGGGGNDILKGENGNDVLNGFGGGVEQDILTGGSGTDTFVLGDSSSVFYQGYGGYDFALITDFNLQSDEIQVMGSGNSYSLRLGNWFGGSSSPQDTAILSNNDYIGILQDTTGINSQHFTFV